MHMNTLASRKLQRITPVGSSSHSFSFTWTNRREMLETVPEIPTKISKDIGTEKIKLIQKVNTPTVALTKP